MRAIVPVRVVLVLLSTVAVNGCTGSDGWRTYAGNGGKDASIADGGRRDAVAAPDSGEGPASDEDGGTSDADAGQGFECRSTRPLLNDLVDLCYLETRPCEGYRVRLRLFLDIGSDLFSFYSDGRRAEDGPFVSLLGHCVIEGRDAGSRAAGMSFEYDHDESVDPEIIPGVKGQLGWKVEIERAVIEYCDGCYMMTGLAPVYGLRGSLEDVEFVRDLKDELPLFIEVRDTEGNLVADIR